MRRRLLLALAGGLGVATLLPIMLAGGGSGEKYRAATDDCRDTYVSNVRALHDQGADTLDGLSVTCAGIREEVSNGIGAWVDVTRPMPAEMTSKELRKFLGDDLYEQVKDDPAFRTSDYGKTKA